MVGSRKEGKILKRKWVGFDLCQILQTFPVAPDNEIKHLEVVIANY